MEIFPIILVFKHITTKIKQIYFIDNEGYKHYVVSLDDVNKLIISKKNLTFLDLVAPFSYFFIIYSLFLLVFLLGYMVIGRISPAGIQFQQSITGIHHCYHYHFIFCTWNDHPL